MSIKNAFKYIFAIVALIFEGFFGIIPFVLFVGQIILLAFSLLFLVRLFRRKPLPRWDITIRHYIVAMLAIIGFFTTIFLSFVQYQYIFPGIVSDITLSGSTGQQVVFVQMSHIATPKFYESKKATIANLSQSGYIILMEGVKPGTPENQALFAQSIGCGMTPDLYGEIGGFLGLVSQDNHSLFAGIGTGSLVSVDLSIDEIMHIMGTGAISLDSASGSVMNLGFEIASMRATLTEKEQIFVAWLGRGLLNWSLRNSQDIDSLLTDSQKRVLFTTIIDRRNDRIVKYIRDHKDQNIVVVYGALHFNGVYEHLQKLDPHWTIAHIENSEPYSR